MAVKVESVSRKQSGQPYGELWLVDYTRVQLLQGSVKTFWGIVDCYVQRPKMGSKAQPLTHLTFIQDGVRHTRTWRGKAYSRPYVITLANRFAREVCSGGAE